MQLFTTDNHKTIKGAARGVTTAVLHLAPGKIARRGNVCPAATGGKTGCLRNCIYYGGNGRFPKTLEARIRKTRLMFDRPDLFEAMLIGDVAELVSHAEGRRIAIRPNGTSDVDWLSRFPRFVNTAHELGCTLYDYTKRLDLIATYPSWYDLTFSRSGKNDEDCRRVLDSGRRVAVVFHGTMPRKFWGHAVVNGDNDDLRFLDPSPCIVGLSAKGRARSNPGGLAVISPVE